MVKFEQVKGMDKLSATNQKFFKLMLKKHFAALFTEAFKDYTPVCVEAKRGHLKVTFQNGEWLHYDYNGTWY